MSSGCKILLIQPPLIVNKGLQVHTQQEVLSVYAAKASMNVNRLNSQVDEWKLHMNIWWPFSL